MPSRRNSQQRKQLCLTNRVEAAELLYLASAAQYENKPSMPEGAGAFHQRRQLCLESMLEAEKLLYLATAAQIKRRTCLAGAIWQTGKERSVQKVQRNVKQEYCRNDFHLKERKEEYPLEL
jgi:hypothetical protein